MLDVLYVLATIAFFGLMLGYVACCERLGRSPEAADKNADTRT